MLYSLSALLSLALLVSAAPQPLQKRASSFSGYLHATRLHGSPALNHTLELNNDGNLGYSNPNNGYNYYPSQKDPSRGTLSITGPYCLGASTSKGDSTIKEQSCNETEEQLFTANDRGSYVVLSLRGTGSSAHPSRPYLKVNKNNDVEVTSTSAGGDNIHLVMYKV